MKRFDSPIIRICLTLLLAFVCALSLGFTSTIGPWEPAALKAAERHPDNVLKATLEAEADHLDDLKRKRRDYEFRHDTLRVETEAIRKIEEVEKVEAEDTTPAAPSEKAEIQDEGPVDDGVWHISPIWWFGYDSAPADGSIGEYAEGLFTAHRYSANGEKIASHPAIVEVYGQRYAYSYTKVLSYNSPESDMTESYFREWRQNGGIMLMTCEPAAGYFQANSYVPLDGSYPYNFTIFPYVTSDGDVVNGADAVQDGTYRNWEDYFAGITAAERRQQEEDEWYAELRRQEEEEKAEYSRMYNEWVNSPCFECWMSNDTACDYSMPCPYSY